jgi:long-chain acyl-CoA synthetase
MTDLGFWKVAQADPSHLALVEPDGTEHSAGEVLAACNQIVDGLRALGLQPGDVVATVLPNGAAMFELTLAILQAGWYLVPMNHHLAGPEIAYILQDSEAKAFVAHERFADAVTVAVKEAGYPPEASFAVGEIPGFRPYAELKEGRSTEMPSDRKPGAVMNYTAGTTGRPKGVRRPIPDIDPDLQGTMHGAFLLLFTIQAHDDNVHLVVSPLYHTAVLTFALDSLHFGHTAVIMDKWSAEETLRLIERYKVTTSHMVPTQFRRLLTLPDEVKAKYDLSSLRHMIHSAAPCPVDVKQRMLDWWGPVIDEYYAASEGGGTLALAEDWIKKPGTVGKAWPISQIKVLDDDDNELPPGEPGTVWIKMGDYKFEYHKDKAKTDKSWKEGFFTVGDVGYLDEDGFLFLNDRKIDMIISGGVNIYPAEIEKELASHPKVGDVAVFGIPHDDWGEEVKAVIEPAEGIAPSPELAAELEQYCRARLAGYKVPRSFDFIEEMPRDPNGKLYKRKLRDPYWAGKERAI